MSYSTALYKLVDIIPASHPPCNTINFIIHTVYVALGQFIIWHHLPNNSQPRKCPVLEHGGPKIRSKVNKQINTKSVLIFWSPNVP